MNRIIVLGRDNVATLQRFRYDYYSGFITNYYCCVTTGKRKRRS